MRFDIEEEHFTVFNLLLLLLAWSATLNSIFMLKLFFPFIPIPLLIIYLISLSNLLLVLCIMVVTIYISIKWAIHHKLGTWLLIVLIFLFVSAMALELTVKNIYQREQLFRQEQLR